MEKEKQEREGKKRLFTRIEPQKTGESKPAGRLFSPVKPQSVVESKSAGRLFTHVTPQKMVEDKPTERLFSHVDTAEEVKRREEKAGHSVTVPPKIVSHTQNTGQVPATVGQSAAEKVTAEVVVETTERRNFELRLKKIIRKMVDTRHGEREDWYYEWEIYIGGDMVSTVVTAEEVSKMSWVKKATRGMAIFKPGSQKLSFDEYVSHLLQQSSAETYTVYTTNGWKKVNGMPTYVYNDGNVGEKFQNVSGDGRYRFEYCIEAVGTSEIFNNVVGMLDICDDKKVSLPLFLFNHVGVLTSLFEESGNPVKFMLAVIGETNSRKTAMTLCMTKLFNRKEIQKPEVTFSSTEGGIEKEIGSHPDSVLVIDDFMPADTKTKQAELDKKLEKVTRLYGDRKEIERMMDFAKNPNAGYYPIRGIGIITGEHIHGVPSSLTRHLILPVTTKTVQNKVLSLYQKDWKILTTHVYDFIAWVTEYYVWCVKFLSERIGGLRQAENISEIPRYVEMYAVLSATAEIFLTYGISRGFLEEKSVNVLLGEWQAIILQVIRENERLLKTKHWGEALREVCRAIYESGETETLPTEEQPNYGDQIFMDASYLYIRLDTFLERTRSYFRLWGVEWANFSKQAVLNEMERLNLIETKGKTEGKRTLKLPGSKRNKQRFLYIRLEKILEREEN
ncbi:hypothetical protein [Sellimonas intestinalis]|uniref:hypothetical protein n=1 Tax=Sellimonas intestinalis TaxID=1653434 RepID=UPI0015EC6C82|nr:hypothetical protein [Sellimonas intestinalis]MBA2214171.1 hypothetical protein [Sellimonas intestinalis]